MTTAAATADCPCAGRHLLLLRLLLLDEQRLALGVIMMAPSRYHRSRASCGGDILPIPPPFFVARSREAAHQASDQSPP